MARMGAELLNFHPKSASVLPFLRRPRLSRTFLFHGAPRSQVLAMPRPEIIEVRKALWQIFHHMGVEKETNRYKQVCTTHCSSTSRRLSHDEACSGVWFGSCSAKLPSCWFQTLRIILVAQTPRRTLISSAAMATRERVRPRSPSGAAADEECVACMAAPATITFKPCGHTVMCEPCLHKVSGAPRCVLCRQSVTSMTRRPLGTPNSQNPLSQMLSQLSQESASSQREVWQSPYPTPPGPPVICVCGQRCGLAVPKDKNRVYWRCPGAGCFKTFVAWAASLESTTVPTDHTRVYCPFCNSHAGCDRSNSAANPGRVYWRCPGGLTKSGKRCGKCFIAWASST